MPFTNILFPVDFSDRCRAMAPQVKAMCDRFQASLTVLHLVEVPVNAYATVEAPNLFQFPMEEMKRLAEEQLEKFTTASFPGMAVTRVVRRLTPKNRSAPPKYRFAPWFARGRRPDRRSADHAIL